MTLARDLDRFTPGGPVDCDGLEGELVRLQAREQGPLGAWCQVDLEDRTGRVVLVSDHGTWSYWWPPGNRGPYTLAAFLWSAGSQYLCGKLLGSASQIDDIDQTVLNIKHRILEERHAGDLTAVEARSEWDLVRELEESRELNLWFGRTDLQDGWDCGASMTNPSWTQLWDRLWVPFIQPQLKALVESEQAAERVGGAR